MKKCSAADARTRGTYMEKGGADTRRCPPHKTLQSDRDRMEEAPFGVLVMRAFSDAQVLQLLALPCYTAGLVQNGVRAVEADWPSGLQGKRSWS